MCTCAYMCVNIHMCTCAYMCVNIHMCTCAYICVNIHMCTCAYMQTYTCAKNVNIHICIHANIHMYRGSMVLPIFKFGGGGVQTDLIYVPAAEEKEAEKKNPKIQGTVDAYT